MPYDKLLQLIEDVEGKLENVIRFVYKIKTLAQYRGISEQLKFEANYSLDTEHFYFDGLNLIMFINKNRLSTQDAIGLKEWLKTNPLTFDYISADPTFEPLPEADQEAIRKLKTFYPNTVIQTGCWNEVEYVADTKTWIENKLNGVTELALGGK